MNRCLIGIAVVALGLPIAGRAQDGPTSVKIGWETLATEGELFNDPFSKCSQQQLQQLSNVLRVRRLISEEKLSDKSEDAIDDFGIADAADDRNVIPIYQVDALVRRATALQLTPEAKRNAGTQS